MRVGKVVLAFDPKPSPGPTPARTWSLQYLKSDCCEAGLWGQSGFTLTKFEVPHEGIMYAVNYMNP